MVGSERSRQLEARRDAVEHDDPVGAHVASHRHRVEPEAARALDYRGIALAQAGAREAVEDLGEGAVRRRRDVVGDLIGDVEDEAARPQIVIVAVRVVEVGRGSRHAVGAGLARAAAHLVAQAHRAAAAREEVEEGDAVSLAKRQAGGVHADPGTETLDAAAHLVAEGEVARRRAIDLLHLAAPDVKVRAADPGTRQLDEDGAGFGIRHRIFAKLELAAVGWEHRDSTLHGRLPKFVVVGIIQRVLVGWAEGSGNSTSTGVAGARRCDGERIYLVVVVELLKPGSEPGLVRCVADEKHGVSASIWGR